MRHNEHLKVVKFRPIICDTFLQIFISAMFVMGIAESLTVDRKTREIALLCKNRTIKLWTWFQPVFKLLFRGFRQFKLKNGWHFHKFQEKFQEQMYPYFLDLRLLTQRNLALELPYSTNFKAHLRSLWAFKNCSVGIRFLRKHKEAIWKITLGRNEERREKCKENGERIQPVVVSCLVFCLLSSQLCCSPVYLASKCREKWRKGE